MTFGEGPQGLAQVEGTPYFYPGEHPPGGMVSGEVLPLRLWSCFLLVPQGFFLVFHPLSY